MGSEMEVYRDERSECWQESPQGEAFEEIIESVDSALEAVAGIAL